MENKEYLNIEDVSAILGICRKNTYKLFHLKGFPAVKIGKKYLVRREAFDRFLQEYEGSTIFLE